MSTIKKGDKIRIKENLMEELVKFGFNEGEMIGFVDTFKGTSQIALDVYQDEENETNSIWVTVDVCSEIPISACELAL